MEHAEARELLEVAAVEPEGFDRLVAGDTPEAAALAGHLAGCPDCADEMERLRRAATLIRSSVRSLPPPDLRDRTLAFVAAVGRDRSGVAVATMPGAAMTSTPPSGVVKLDAARRTRASGGAGSRRGLTLWAASVAAAVMVAIVGTSAWVGRVQDERAAAQAQQIASLAKVATWSLRIDAEPDAQYVELASASGATASLVFSPTSTELVVLASGLEEPPAGQEYRCWLETESGRLPIGKMFFGGGVSYWVGEVATVGQAVDGTRFGVSLVPVGGDAVSGDAVLLGEL
ncbi:MAG TPA: anti-sigma factor [Candidatus Limnocylindrales bacterium]|nr:anti-sigma factor [Candidatus Limnocylindrales bacterium]